MDVTLERRELPAPVVAALDWSAHHVWTVLALRALPDAAREAAAGPALATSIAIDVDHVPLALELLRRNYDVPRPRTHTFLTPLAVAAIAAALPRGSTARRRTLGAAFGTAVHLTRDLFNGPGVDVVWPLRAGHVRLPVAAEGVVLLTLLARAARR